MALDVQALAHFAARTLEDIERDDDLPTDAELVDAVLIVEVHGTDEEQEAVSMVQGFTMSERNVVGVGLMVRGLVAATRQT
jgi:hypothetical protein